MARVRCSPFLDALVPVYIEENLVKGFLECRLGSVVTFNWAVNENLDASARLRMRCALRAGSHGCHTAKNNATQRNDNP